MIINDKEQPTFEIEWEELKKILFELKEAGLLEGSDSAALELRRQLRRFYNKGYVDARNDERELEV